MLVFGFVPLGDSQPFAFFVGAATGKNGVRYPFPTSEMDLKVLPMWSGKFCYMALIGLSGQKLIEVDSKHTSSRLLEEIVLIDLPRILGDDLCWEKICLQFHWRVICSIDWWQRGFSDFTWMQLNLWCDWRRLTYNLQIMFLTTFWKLQAKVKGLFHCN